MEICLYYILEIWMLYCGLVVVFCSESECVKCMVIDVLYKESINVYLIDDSFMF